MIQYKKMFGRIKKRHLVIKIIPILIVIYILKVVFHTYGFEIVSLSSLFTSLIAATTFLIGFLISGVISDYKESEKIPGDIASSIETIHGEIYILNKNKGNKLTEEFLVKHKDFANLLIKRFYRKERTSEILLRIREMDDYFAQFESIIQPNFLTRVKNEQANLRKMVIRIDSIRDLSFIPSAYAIVEILGLFVVMGLLVLKIEPFYESVFFSIIVSFLIVYMILLIKDLDNPFDYSEHGEKSTEVSLKPIHDVVIRI